MSVVLLMLLYTQVPHQYPPEVLKEYTSRGKVEWTRPPLREMEQQ